MYIFHFLFAFGVANLLVKYITIRSVGIAIAEYFAVVIITTAGAFGLAKYSDRYIEDVGINFGKRLIQKMGTKVA